ncbi:MAG: hypothetical protein LBF69_05600 [Prevotellaceae bacterium]|jgi:hypothetical protein|nr:hypothetical protein [Prevotellaceae bacterium]
MDMYPIDVNGREVSDSYALSANSLRINEQWLEPAIGYGALAALAFKGMGSGIAPYISAAVDAGVNLYGIISNRDAVSASNEANIQLSREQMAWQEAMWNKQNAYNTPAAQMQRFSQAGLNPNLIYGQGSSGNAQSVGNYQRANVSPEKLEGLERLAILGHYLDLSYKAAQVDNVKVQNDLLVEQAALAAQQAWRASFDNSIELGLWSDDVELDSLSNRRSHMQRYAYEAKRANYQRSVRDLEALDVDISNKRIQGRILSSEAVSKQIESELNALGVSTHDPIWQRLIAKLLTMFGISF